MITIPKKTYMKKKQPKRRTKESSTQQVQNEDRLKLCRNSKVVLNSNASSIKLNSNSQQASLASDYWKDSFDKLLEERSLLREKNVIKKIVNASYNRNSFYENSTGEKSRFFTSTTKPVNKNSFTNKKLLSLQNDTSTVNASTPIFKSNLNSDLIFPITPIQRENQTQKCSIAGGDGGKRKYFITQNMYDTQGNLKPYRMPSLHNLPSFTIQFSGENSEISSQVAKLQHYQLQKNNDDMNDDEDHVNGTKKATLNGLSHRKTTRKRKTNEKGREFKQKNKKKSLRKKNVILENEINTVINDVNNEEINLKCKEKLGKNSKQNNGENTESIELIGWESEKCNENDEIPLQCFKKPVHENLMIENKDDKSEGSLNQLEKTKLQNDPKKVVIKLKRLRKNQNNKFPKINNKRKNNNHKINIDVVDLINKSKTMIKSSFSSNSNNLRKIKLRQGHRVISTKVDNKLNPTRRRLFTDDNSEEVEDNSTSLITNDNLNTMKYATVMLEKLPSKSSSLSTLKNNLEITNTNNITHSILNTSLERNTLNISKSLNQFNSMITKEKYLRVLLLKSRNNLSMFNPKSLSSSPASQIMKRLNASAVTQQLQNSRTNFENHLKFNIRENSILQKYNDISNLTRCYVKLKKTNSLSSLLRNSIKMKNSVIKLKRLRNNLINSNINNNNNCSRIEINNSLLSIINASQDIHSLSNSSGIVNSHHHQSLKLENNLTLTITNDRKELSTNNNNNNNNDVEESTYMLRRQNTNKSIEIIQNVSNCSNNVNEINIQKKTIESETTIQILKSSNINVNNSKRNSKRPKRRNELDLLILESHSISSLNNVSIYLQDTNESMINKKEFSEPNRRYSLRNRNPLKTMKDTSKSNNTKMMDDNNKSVDNKRQTRSINASNNNKQSSPLSSKHITGKIQKKLMKTGTNITQSKIGRRNSKAKSLPNNNQNHAITNKINNKNKNTVVPETCCLKLNKRAHELISNIKDPDENHYTNRQNSSFSGNDNDLLLNALITSTKNLPRTHVKASRKNKSYSSLSSENRNNIAQPTNSLIEINEVNESSPTVESPISQGIVSSLMENRINTIDSNDKMEIVNDVNLSSGNRSLENITTNLNTKAKTQRRSPRNYKSLENDLQLVEVNDNNNQKLNTNSKITSRISLKGLEKENKVPNEYNNITLRRSSRISAKSSNNSKRIDNRNTIEYKNNSNIQTRSTNNLAFKPTTCLETSVLLSPIQTDQNLSISRPLNAISMSNISTRKRDLQFDNHDSNTKILKQCTVNLSNISQLQSQSNNIERNSCSSSSMCNIETASSSRNQQSSRTLRSNRSSRGIRKVSMIQSETIENRSSMQSQSTRISSSTTTKTQSQLMNSSSVLDDSIDKIDFVNTINRNASRIPKHNLFMNNLTLSRRGSSSKISTSKSSSLVNNSGNIPDSSCINEFRNSLNQQKNSIINYHPHTILPAIRDDEDLQESLEISQQQQSLQIQNNTPQIILPPGKWRRSLKLWKKQSMSLNGKISLLSPSSSLTQNRIESSLAASSRNSSLMPINNINYSNSDNSRNQCNDGSNQYHQKSVINKSSHGLSLRYNESRNSQRKTTLNASKSVTVETILEEDNRSSDLITRSRRKNSKVLLESTDDETPTLSTNLLFENSKLKQNLHISLLSKGKSNDENSSGNIEDSNEQPSLLSANESRRKYQQQFSAPSFSSFYQQQQLQLQQQNNQTILSSLLSTSLQLSRGRRTSVVEGSISEGEIAKAIQESIINYQLNSSSASVATTKTTTTTRYQRSLSTKDIVLRRCEQSEPIEFAIEYSKSVLQQCRKIGEGVYGEVYMNKRRISNDIIGDGCYDNNDHFEVNVLKIIPIEGDIEVNGETQKKFDEILSEIVIATELSRLRNDKEFMTSGFVEVKKVRCVQGSYPEHLIDLWELYRDNHGTENDHPEIFPEDQLYIVLELANAGQDLEAFVFENALQSYSAFLQTALSLAVAERKFKFEHRDLHWGNILLAQTKEKEISYRLNGKEFKIPTYGVKATIIDYTLSRMIFDGCCFYNDLSNDDELFSATGDYQFDIYRMMKKTLDNEWERYEPYTNILWLHYVIDKMISGVRYRYSKTKKHRSAVQNMMQLRDELLDYKSASDYVIECLN